MSFRFKNFLLTTAFLLASFPFLVHADISPDSLTDYKKAFVRELSPAFEKSLKMNPPPTPINLKLAEKQHREYIHLLTRLLPEIEILKGDPKHADCNFIEDTAVLIGNGAIITRPGASSRRGEEVPVKKALMKSGIRILGQIQAPGTLDGGDVLYTGKHLFVGLSRRTNPEAISQLKKILNGKTPVIGIPVSSGLHLKSILSLFDSETIVIASEPAGKVIQEQIEKRAPHSYTFVKVPDTTASNVLRVGSNLIMQEGFPESEKILQAECKKKQVQLLKLSMSELIKADGALTCGSLLSVVQ